MDDRGKRRLNLKMFALKDELMFVIGPEINPFFGKLIFTKSKMVVGGSDDVTTNAGFGLVDTGEKKLLVTCHHVWKEFLKERERNSQARMSVCFNGRTPIVFDKYEPIGQDESLDIATFDISPVLGACGKHKFYPLKQKPAPRVAKGYRLVLLGAQGMYRSLTDTGLEFGITTYLVHVSSVDGFRFHASISNLESEYVLQEVRKPKSSEHGGISGSPCFLMKENCPCQLVGFVTGELLDYFCFVHASCLNPDGTIKKAATAGYCQAVGTN